MLSHHGCKDCSTRTHHGWTLWDVWVASQTDCSLFRKQTFSPPFTLLFSPYSSSPSQTVLQTAWFSSSGAEASWWVGGSLNLLLASPLWNQTMHAAAWGDRGHTSRTELPHNSAVTGTKSVTVAVTVHHTGSPQLAVPLCFGGWGGVRVLLQEPLGAVSTKVEKAACQEVRVWAGGGGRGVLPSLVLVLFAFLLEGQRGERNHATGQRGELRLSALTVVLPGLVRWDGVWGEEQREDGVRAS